MLLKQDFRIRSAERENYGPVRLPYPNKRARKLAKIALVLFLIVLTVLGSIGTWLPGLFQAFGSLFPSPAIQDSLACTGSQSSLGPAVLPSPNCPTTPGNSPVFAGANGAANIPMPRTILSNIDNVGSGMGWSQDSPQNVTLHNSALAMRLLGGSDPHDVLVGTDRQALSRMSWNIDASINDTWLPLTPTTNSFQILGTNTTGTYALRNMTLSRGPYSGVLLVAYKATDQGALKWDISFLPSNTLEYRLVYSWTNIGRTSSIDTSSRTFSVREGFSTYQFSWSDLPSTLNSIASTNGNDFTLAIDLGLSKSNSRITIDPSLSSSSTYGATDFQFQRKVFQDSTGRYFVFFYNGSSVYYASSPDGVTWISKQSMPLGWPSYSDPLTSQPSVAYYGGRVVVAAGNSTALPQCNTSPSCPYTAYFPYAFGTISGGTIIWGPTQRVTLSGSCNWFQTCTVGAKYVYSMLSPNGDYAFSYNFFNTTTSNSYTNHVSLFYVRGSSSYAAVVEPPTTRCCYNFPLESVVIPEGDPSNGIVRIVYENVTNPCCSGVQLDSRTFSSVTSTLGGVDFLDQLQSSSGTLQWSVATDAEYGLHLVAFSYGCPNGSACYRYHSPGGSWTAPADVFKNSVSGPVSPTITVDLSTDIVYVLAWGNLYFDPQWNTIGTMFMRTKSPGQDPGWSDGVTSTQFRVRAFQKLDSLPSLGSALGPSSSTNSSSISLVWTEGTGPPYNIMLGAIPIQTVWSPYTSPSHPGNGNGMAPNGQYFHNLDEAVSPSTGSLTITQSDFNVPGRGLSLEITRVFGGASMVPIGIGWGFNFPLYDGTNNAVYLWNGESYKFPVNWLNGCFPHCVWENHQGEYFRLVQNLDYTIDLITKTGVTYHFDNTGNRLLLRITDATGSNSELFNYNGLVLSSITDTIGRTFLFCYTSFSYLGSIDQVSGGTCSSETGFVRRVSYSYLYTGHLNIYNLAGVTDPAGRQTQFQYNAVADSSAATNLISRITYPTGWYSNYTYFADPISSSSSMNIAYRVLRQRTNSTSGTIIRQYTYSYTHDPNSGVISGSSVTAYNGTSVGNYINYAYFYNQVRWNVSDPQHPFVRGMIQTFGTHGEIPQEIVFVGDGTGLTGTGHIGSYTNYYSYDSWGNLIYSRASINPSANKYHEQFNSYYNDGLPPGFNAFQDSFGQNNKTATDNPWKVQNGYWLVKNGAYNGTETNGSMESMASSNNIGLSDLSFQTRVYVGRQINFDPTDLTRLGIFAHSIGKFRWSLDLANETSSGNFLELHDEWYQWLGVNGQPSAKTSCPLIRGVWYTFNMTVHGYSVLGWASTPGYAACNVSGVFSTSSPAAQGTAFGLSAGGYSALFENVTVTTVTPYITTTGFSNSFYQNSSPSVLIHSLRAGTAELQNGTGSAPIESYVGYTSWGGASKSKQLYTSNGSSSWLTTSRAFDNYGNPTRLTDPRGNQTTFGYSPVYGSAYLTSVNQTLNPGGSLISKRYSYDFRLGTMLSSVGPNGHTTTYQYDILGRLASIDYPTTSAGQPQVDGSAVAGCGPHVSTCSVGFQTTQYNDIIIVFASGTLGSGPSSCTFSVSDALGLTLTPRSAVTYGRYVTPYYADALQEFYAKAPSPLSSDLITLTVTNANACGPNYIGLQVFAISGANFSNPFDPNSSLPGGGSDNSQGQQKTTSATISTTNSNDFVFAAVQHGTNDPPLAQAGFTLIESGGIYGAEYKVTGLPLANYAVTFGFHNSSYWQEIADAIQLSGSIVYQDYVRNSYNDASNFVDTTNENGWQTRQIFDGLGRLSTVERFLGMGGPSYSNETLTYNWMSETVTTTDALGYTYSNTYDPIGRVTGTIKPDGNTTSLSYNDLQGWVISTDEYGAQNGNHRCNTYDRQGRLLSVVEHSDTNCNPLSLGGQTYTTNYSYDEVGNLRKTTTANTKATTYTYDNLNRLIQTTYPDQTSESFSYDLSGNVILKTDRKGTQTSSSYDSLNRPTAITYQGATTTSNYLTYDINSNLLVMGSQNASIIYSYDIRNRLICESYSINGGTRSGPCGGGGSGGGSVAYGTLITMIDGSKLPVQNLHVGDQMLGYNTTTNKFVTSSVTSIKSVDTSNMLIIHTDSGPPFRVDANTRQTLWVKNATATAWTPVTDIHPGDHLFTVNGWVQVTSIEFAPAGNHVMFDIVATAPYFADGYLDPLHKGPTGSTPPGNVGVGYSFAFQYLGETPADIMYNDSVVAGYSYDGLGRVSSVSFASTNLAQFTYYPNDQVKGITYGNGLVSNYTYTKLGQPSQETVKNGATILLSLNYGYNKTGTVASVTGQSTTTTGATAALREQYSYDPLARLVNSNVTSGSVKTVLSYQYDNLGNRQSQTLNGVTTSYTYILSNNELSSSSIPHGTNIAYSYDPSGNLLTANVTSGKTGTHWSYAWDVPGDLVKVSNYTSVQGFYAYDGLGRRVEAKEGSATTFYGYQRSESLADLFIGGTANDYVYADGLRIARTGSQSPLVYYHTDALGTTRLVTDVNRNIVFSDNYQPFGQDNGTPTGSETYKFTGKPVSQATGLYYDYRRWYDPSIGRFISQDPIKGHRSNPETMNPYAYVTNTPTSETDKTGLFQGSGIDNRCDKLNACGTANGAQSIEVAKDALIFALVVSGGVLACALACPIIIGYATAAVTGCETDPEACDPASPPPPTTDPTPPPVDPTPPPTSSTNPTSLLTGGTGDDAFSATRGGVAYTLSSHAREGLPDLAKAFGTDEPSALSVLRSTIEEGVETTPIENTGVPGSPQAEYLTVRDTANLIISDGQLKTPFAVLDPLAGKIVTAYPNELAGDVLSFIGLEGLEG